MYKKRNKVLKFSLILLKKIMLPEILEISFLSREAVLIFILVPQPLENLMNHTKFCI